MKREQVISDGLFREAQAELLQGNCWIAYNTKTYYLDHADMWFFRYKDEAIDFANDNISDQDAYAVIHARSVDELLKQIPYGESLVLPLTEKEIRELFERFDWKKAFYDPLHDRIEAHDEPEKAELEQMETLLAEWEKLYDRDPEAALELACTYWEGQPMERYKDDFLILKFDLMIEKNLEYLKNNVRNHGFGDELGPAIEAQLKTGADEFTLSHKAEVNKREMESTLYFGKSDKSDMYFFNKYDTRVKNERDEMMAQTFYINKGWGVTLKEAYNLLNGRAVYKELSSKEGEKYHAWIQLDFSAKDKHGNYERKQFHENYGYDLKEALSYYFIREMGKEEDMKNLVRSLERGNLQLVTVQAPGGDVRVFIEANPQYKTINIYDNKMIRLGQEKREELMKQPDAGEDKEISQSKGKEKQKEQGLGAEGQDGKKSVKKGKVNGEENGLVKKNRSSTKKGLTM